jgi:hypothetical protein
MVYDGNPKKNRMARRERLGKIAANVAKFIPKEKSQYCKDCRIEKGKRSEERMKEINEKFCKMVAILKKEKDEAIEKLNKENILTIENEAIKGKSRCEKHYKPTN